MHNLYRHLAACDLAVVQGGLTTSMELTAQKRPFLYFPLRHHFEQNFHVRHRLERYGAGRRMDFDDSPPELIAAAIAEEIGREVDYRDVEADGAASAAAPPRRAALASRRPGSNRGPHHYECCALPTELRGLFSRSVVGRAHATISPPRGESGSPCDRTPNSARIAAP